MTEPTTEFRNAKALRGSLERFAEQAALQWLSAFATEQRLVLGQVSWGGGDKAGEIAAAQCLIEELGLKDTLHTLDALHSRGINPQVYRLRTQSLPCALSSAGLHYRCTRRAMRLPVMPARRRSAAACLIGCSAPCALPAAVCRVTRGLP